MSEREREIKRKTVRERLKFETEINREREGLNYAREIRTDRAREREIKTCERVIEREIERER